MTNHNPPAKPFKKSPQGLDDKKSQGQIELAAGYNIQCHMQTFAEKNNMVELVGYESLEQLKDGNTKPALEFLKIATGEKKTALNINNNLGIQKVFISKDDEKNVNKHIEDIINAN